MKREGWNLTRSHGVFHVDERADTLGRETEQAKSAARLNAVLNIQSAPTYQPATLSPRIQTSLGRAITPLSPNSSILSPPFFCVPCPLNDSHLSAPSLQASERVELHLALLCILAPDLRPVLDIPKAFDLIYRE